VEHDILKQWFEKNGVSHDPIAIEKLVNYAHMLDEYNKMTNITGLKSIEDIINTLILMSIKPLLWFDVPRGTSFVDVGTGSGIPGVVLSIWFPHLSGVLIEANGEKIEFLSRAKESLKCDNIKIVNGRVEELGHQSDYRSVFDWCFTRAFGPLYYSIEFGLPLLKKGGLMYIYSSLSKELISADMIEHVKRVGGGVLNADEHKLHGIGKEGIIVFKDSETADCYPRRFAIVKRDAAKIEKTV
jgi:16S rRNA (guanine527-N7)-methyltransferase